MYKSSVLENPEWLIDLPLTSRAQELPGIVENCLLQWQCARRHFSDRRAADTAFRDWLLRLARSQLVESGQTTEQADYVLFMVLGQLVSTCAVSGEIDDAFLVCRWLVDTYVPPGDADAAQAVSGTIRFCMHMAEESAHLDRARELLQYMLRIAPAFGDGSEEFEDALREALQHLHGLYLTDRTSENNRQRTLAAIAVCDAMIERWHASPHDALRVAVADARLQKAKDFTEIGDEQDAERECAGLVADIAADDALLEDRLFMATHARDAMARVAIPEPEFKTEWLEVQMRQDHREGRPGGSPIAQYTETAAALHAATTNLVRRSASFGNPPLVLLLRNFDIVEQSYIEGERYSQSFHFGDGLKLINRLAEVTWMVRVASTNAAGLEIDWYTESILHQKVLRPLYLPHAEWQHTVRLLAAVAEYIVIWAKGKTPGLLDELGILRELGRTQDTVVLLEDSSKPGNDAVNNAVLKVFLDKSPSAPVPPLTADDEILADFPAAMMAADMKRDDPDESPFIRTVAYAVAEAWELSPVERVQRVRERMAWL